MKENQKIHKNYFNPIFKKINGKKSIGLTLPNL